MQKCRKLSIRQMSISSFISGSSASTSFTLKEKNIYRVRVNSLQPFFDQKKNIELKYVKIIS